MGIFKYGPLKALFALMSVVVLLPQAISASFAQVEENIRIQNDYMYYLESEFYADYTPVDESKIASFDIEKAVADGVKYNEVAFLGTHNSYQLESTDEFKKLYEAVDVMTFSIVDSSKATFNMDTITEQLQLGIRSLEIDVETVLTDEVSFVVCHDPLLDNTSSCYDFEKMLEEIKMWSDANPNHLPISIIIEPKQNVIPINNIRSFTLDYLNAFDALLREKLGDTLLTPDDMMGDNESLKAMREADDWLSLGDTLGKVLVLLHDTNVTDDYIEQDETIRSQAMFPMLRYADRDESYASFIIDNEPDTAKRHKEESIDNCNLIVRTRADSFPTYSEDRYVSANECGSQIISTDYPVRAEESEHHVYSFDGYTVKLAN